MFHGARDGVMEQGVTRDPACGYRSLSMPT